MCHLYRLRIKTHVLNPTPCSLLSRDRGHAHSATDPDNDNLALFFRAASFRLVFPRYVFHVPSYLKWFRKYYMYIITFSGISHPRCERMSTSKLSAQDIKGTRKKSAHFVTIAFDGLSFRILPPTLRWKKIFWHQGLAGHLTKS